MLTSLKGVASTKLVRDLGISQKSAWHLDHRIRAAFTNGQDSLMLGSIDVDETYIGAKANNQNDSQRDGKRGVGDKYSVVGIRDRATGESVLKPSTTRKRTSCRAILKRTFDPIPMRPSIPMR